MPGRVHLIRTARSSADLARWLWRLYLAVGACSVAGYMFLPGEYRPWALLLLGLSAGIAVLLGMRLHRPVPSRPWLAIGIGIFLTLVAGAIYGLLEAESGGAAPFPSVADAIHLLGSLVATVGLVGLARTGNNGRDHGTLLDALIVATALGVLAWIAFLHAYFERWGVSLATGVAIAYPFIDLVWLVLAIRLVLAPTRRGASQIAMAAGITAILASSLVDAFQLVAGTYRVGDIVDLGWIAGYVLVGTSALHPTMAVTTGPASVPLERRVSMRRIMALGIAALLPTILLWHPEIMIQSGHIAAEPVHLAGLAVGAVAMTLLVMLRMVDLVGGLNDVIAQRRRLERKLRHAADHDPLVGLWNRRVFHDRLAELLAAGDTGLAALFIDIDDFKSVNDALGHAAGDRVLAELARRIDGALRPTDLAARLDGDEFGVVLPGCDSPDTARAIASRLLSMLEMPLEIDGRAHRICASVGIALARDAGDATTLMRNADIAMYLAKERGKDRIEFFEEGAHVEVIRRLELRGDLERALDAGQFVLVYQPVVELDSNTVVGVEALIRWNHPERGRVLPGEFIATLEELGLIVPVGRWVIREACRQLARWQHEQGAHDLFMSVNVSPLQLRDPGLSDDIAAAIADAGITPASLVLEITEGVLLDVERSVPVLKRLRSHGVRIALDDFGTGYSTMSALTRVPLDIMKIDRSFVTPLESGGRDAALVENLLQIAASMGVEPIAEGIEVDSQRQVLMDLGCRLGQGFLMCVPSDAGTVAELLEQQRMPVEAGAPSHPADLPSIRRQPATSQARAALARRSRTCSAVSPAGGGRTRPGTAAAGSCPR